MRAVRIARVFQAFDLNIVPPEVRNREVGPDVDLVDVARRQAVATEAEALLLGTGQAPAGIITLFLQQRKTLFSLFQVRT
jgi:hypothetical protein